MFATSSPRRFRKPPRPLAAEAEWNAAQRTTRLPRWIPKRYHPALRVTWRLGLTALSATLALVLFYLCLSFRYDLNTITRMPERSVVYDATGRELGTLHGENRRLLTRKSIPPFLVQALEAREDARFFNHHGVDPRGVGRATLRNLRDRSFTQGASTLTMQLARNTYDLWDSSLHRKLLEMALALRIEAHYSKDEILTAYLNRIYFGSGSYGLEEASRNYFGVGASELNRNQCALLVGIIRAPHACSPYRNIRGAAEQRDEVLRRMITEGSLPESHYQEIRSLPLNLLEDPRPGSSQALRAARRHFDELLLPAERRQGGLTIRTTIQLDLQTRLEQTLQELAAGLPADTQWGALCLDSETGAIRAITGGRQQHPARFNRALDAQRDLGPAFTPFLCAMAAERGTPCAPGQPLSTGRALGRAEVLRLAKRLGFTGSCAENDDDLYRGSLTASPLQVATAASALLNGGQLPRPFFIEQIQSPAQEVFFRHRPSLHPVLAKPSTTRALQTCFPSGEPRLLTALTPGERDFWALAFGRRHTLCLWIGNDENTPLQVTASQRQDWEEAMAALGKEL